jgi:hypothetical protein
MIIDELGGAYKGLDGDLFNRKFSSCILDRTYYNSLTVLQWCSKTTHITYSSFCEFLDLPVRDSYLKFGNQDDHQ